ncbi:hypothetical protein ACFLW7_03460, partial [Chloroflexota bacterium]
NNPALCHRSTFCVTRDIWGEMKDAMSQVLDSTTLQDLVERQKRRGHPEDIGKRQTLSKRPRHR